MGFQDLCCGHAPVSYTHLFDEPKQWEIREINDIMNNSVTGWRAFSNPRYFRSPYGRQKGWERIQPDNAGGDFQELTPEEVEPVSYTHLGSWMAKSTIMPLETKNWLQ